jgi:hypothetical protein
MGQSPVKQTRRDLMKRMTLAVAVAACLAGTASGQDDVLTPAGKSYSVGVLLDVVPLVFEEAEAGALSGVGQLGDAADIGTRDYASVRWERDGSAITLTGTKACSPHA